VLAKPQNADDDDNEDDEDDEPGPAPPPGLKSQPDDEEPEFPGDDDDDYAPGGGEDEFPVSHEVVLKDHTKVVSALTLDPSGARILSGSHDYDVKLWDFGGMDAGARAKPFKSWEPAGSYYVRVLCLWFVWLSREGCLVNFSYLFSDFFFLSR
jgi:WD repeat-containing protein 70